MFNIGDIVAFNTHPFFAGHTDIVLAGDPLQQSPLMIITEEKNITLSADKGHKKKGDSFTHYKCCWYSATTHRFEFAWFDPHQLKLIEPLPPNFDTVPAIGCNVIFRTARIETQKKKGSIQYGTGMATEDHLGLKSLMSFVSPVMHVIGYPSNNGKSDKKQTATLPAFPLVKVKWFNLGADKYSEAELPLSCLEKLPPFDTEKIAAIKNSIAAKLSKNKH